MLLTSQNGQPLNYTQGDVVTLELLATDDQGNPVDLTGVSLETQILGPNSVGPITFPNGQHTIADQSTNRGQFALALAAADTMATGDGAHKQILTESTLTGVITTYRGVNLLTVFVAVPIQ
jgi:hypothetical protein